MNTSAGLFFVDVALPVMLVPLCMHVSASALFRKNYKRVAAIGFALFAADAALLFFYKEMPVVEALLRSFAGVLIYMAGTYVFAHFLYHERSFRDLFRRF
jgi:glucose-6-phosphate-specific signal transduction histidine kinase